MIFTETALAGAFVIALEKLEDERGYFARSFGAREFAGHGLESRFVQCGISFNRRRGTLRGLHYQAAPHAQAKLVRCSRGRAFDVIVDLRAGSPGYARWFASELAAAAPRLLYIPAGFAHGFQTLEDDTELFYQMSQDYDPAAERGIRWNDPRLGIDWPSAESRVISARDAALPALDNERE